MLFQNTVYKEERFVMWHVQLSCHYEFKFNQCGPMLTGKLSFCGRGPIFLYEYLDGKTTMVVNKQSVSVSMHKHVLDNQTKIIHNRDIINPLPVTPFIHCKTKYKSYQMKTFLFLCFFLISTC